jgi:hypothetical protein
VEDGLESSPFGSGCSYADASIYVDARESSRAVAWLQDSFGCESGGGHLMVGPVRVSGAHNDYATGRTAHPFEFLEWPTVLECEAPAGVPPAEVVAAVAAVLETLWRGGFKAVAACDFEDDLPACGGLARYPVPAVSDGAWGSAGLWWKGLFSFRKRKN